MGVNLKERNIGTLLLIVVVGILVGSYLNSLIGMIPGNNVVKMFFTYNIIHFGAGFPHAFVLDLDAIKLQFGFQMKFSLLSAIGIVLGLYFFRWYK